ncbi:dissimilatory sulfite reductase (desulfoviridin) alpha/beta subunit [Clostridium beijerinckii]|nr:dissimilatory sulfite reductase (desulfoviridin) alpha/beta subunit [Clostridium beijerinckii]
MIQEISQKYGDGNCSYNNTSRFEVPGISFEDMDKVNELLQPIIEN